MRVLLQALEQLITCIFKYGKYEYKTKQEIIPVGCILPSCKLLQWPPPDVVWGELNVEHVSSVCRHMSAAGRLGCGAIPGLMFGGRAGPCTARSKASWVMVTLGPHSGQKE